MEIQHNARLTSAELGYLWGVNLADSMHVCVFKYFLKHIEDPNIKTLLCHGLDLSQQHVEIVRNICETEGIKFPQFFTDEDVNLKADRLFSDTFYLFYLKHLARGGLMTHAAVLPNMFRSDIRSFGSKCIESSLELENEVTSVLLEKGLAVRPPYIPYPDKVEKILKQSFMFEWLGNKRGLTAIEISDLYMNITTNQLGSSIAAGFAQTATSEKVRKFIERGKDLAIKQVKVYGDYLQNHSLPIPQINDLEVTDSTDSPFSDKLLMVHFTLMIHSGVGNLGKSISESQRSDLTVDYTRIMAEVLKYSEDGMNILVENGWLEKPPTSSNEEN